MNRFFWKLRSEIDAEPASRLATTLDIPKAGARFLVSRSLTTPQAAELYLFPSESSVNDPWAFENMREAVSVVECAVREGKRVLIHGDYDVDGIAGTAMMYRFLSDLVPEVFRFLPDRRKDSYGLSERAVDWAINNDVGLVIAVDCGTSDGGLVKKLLTKGIDAVICDHHEFPADEIAEGILLNPLREGEKYPFRDLCGTGVAFKLIAALEESGLAASHHPEDFLDLLALATIGDMAPLVDENRYYVRAGLERINRVPRAGLEAIRNCSKLQGREITARHIAFVFAPRLNAPGRVSNPKPSLEILCTDMEAEAESLARVLELENEKRRELTEIVHRDVENLIDEMPDRDEKSGYILAGASWDEGVLGIAASRVVETLGKPAILMSILGDVAKGSGRSVPGVNLKAQLDQCRHHLIRYGGHAQAVGLTIESSRIAAFEQELSDRLKEAMAGIPAQPVLQIDADLGIEECTTDLLGFLSACEPFGIRNREPVWRMRNMRVRSDSGFVGSSHLKLYFQDTAGRSAEGISFNWERPVGPAELRGKTVDLAVRVQKGYYLERVHPEIRILDVQLQEQGERSCER